jgi:hypothetical protein
VLLLTHGPDARQHTDVALQLSDLQAWALVSEWLRKVSAAVHLCVKRHGCPRKLKNEGQAIAGFIPPTPRGRDGAQGGKGGSVIRQYSSSNQPPLLKGRLVRCTGIYTHHATGYG